MKLFLVVFVLAFVLYLKYYGNACVCFSLPSSLSLPPSPSLYLAFIPSFTLFCALSLSLSLSLSHCRWLALSSPPRTPLFSVHSAASSPDHLYFLSWLRFSYSHTCKRADLVVETVFLFEICATLFIGRYKNGEYVVILIHEYDMSHLYYAQLYLTFGTRQIQRLLAVAKIIHEQNPYITAVTL